MSLLQRGSQRACGGPVRRGGFGGQRLAAQAAGHEVVGIFMKNWEDDDDSEYCSSNVDFVDAAAVADVIGIEIEARQLRGRIQGPRVCRVPA
jgi:hypothetical protein